MSELITVPTFTFEQGRMLEDVDVEYPISVDYYNGTICLRQEHAGEIKICPKYLDSLFKEIRKHQKAANFHLNTKFK